MALKVCLNGNVKPYIMKTVPFGSQTVLLNMLFLLSSMGNAWKHTKVFLLKSRLQSGAFLLVEYPSLLVLKLWFAYHWWYTCAISWYVEVSP